MESSCHARFGVSAKHLLLGLENWIRSRSSSPQPSSGSSWKRGFPVSLRSWGGSGRPLLGYVRAFLSSMTHLTFAHPLAGTAITA
jgi:hypothetical protein